MSVQDQLAEAGQKAAEAARAKAQEFWEYIKTRGRLHAKLEWKRTQHRIFRKIRDLYEPPPVPAWIEQKMAKTGADETIDLPFKRDAEPFLSIPLRFTRRLEVEDGWLAGRVNGRDVRFTLPEEFKDALLEFHDPTIDIELEEREEEAALARLPER